MKAIMYNEAARVPAGKPLPPGWEVVWRINGVVLAVNLNSSKELKILK